MLPKKISERHNVFGDGIAFVEHWDFSNGNRDEQSRIVHITKVASVCYDNPNAVGREALYNRLKAESIGLPSSSFEFVPVLLTGGWYQEIVELYETIADSDGKAFTPRVEKYGEWLMYGLDSELDLRMKYGSYLLTNYRALLYDYEFLSSRLDNVPDLTHQFNTEDECKFINDNLNTFLYKMDQVTAKQHNRHRTMLQELSRRYVSGKKTPFEFYISDGMKPIVSRHPVKLSSSDDYKFVDITTSKIHDICESHYYAALKAGIKPQEARRILPQSMYTTLWTAFLPMNYTNYLDLRDDEAHAQWEIAQLAKAMRSMAND